VKKLHEFPIIFVNYTIGSGGWFLASLIQKWIDPSLTLQIDKTGSGHANTYIYHINSLYADFMHSDIGLSIVDDLNYNTYSENQRIEYLRDSIKINNPLNNALVVSLHCANLNIFLKAFPSAKFICINITTAEIIRCRFNFLYKAMAARPELFKGMITKHNKNLEESLAKIKNLTRENLNYFEWTDAEIIKFMPEISYNSDKVMNVQYANYINGDELVFLDAIAEFLNLNISQEQFDQAVADLVTYRFSQPPVPIN
jgi:hypothetical protein